MDTLEQTRSIIGNLPVTARFIDLKELLSCKSKTKEQVLDMTTKASCYLIVESKLGKTHLIGYIEFEDGTNSRKAKMESIHFF